MLCVHHCVYIAFSCFLTCVALNNCSLFVWVQARLAQIDLFSETSGMREASVLRYKEKRRTRLFSKKIRYQVRKINADRRPRMKVRSKNANSLGDQWEI